MPMGVNGGRRGGSGRIHRPTKSMSSEKPLLGRFNIMFFENSARRTSYLPIGFCQLILEHGEYVREGEDRLVGSLSVFEMVGVKVDGCCIGLKTLEVIIFPAANDRGVGVFVGLLPLPFFSGTWRLDISFGSRLVVVSFGSRLVVLSRLIAWFPMVIGSIVLIALPVGSRVLLVVVIDMGEAVIAAPTAVWRIVGTGGRPVVAPPVWPGRAFVGITLRSWRPQRACV